MSLFIGSAPRLAERHRLRCRLPSRHHAHDALLAPNSSPGVGRISFLRALVFLRALGRFARFLCAVAVPGARARIAATCQAAGMRRRMLSCGIVAPAAMSSDSPLTPVAMALVATAPLSTHVCLEHTPVATKVAGECRWPCALAGCGRLAFLILPRGSHPCRASVQGRNPFAQDAGTRSIETTFPKHRMEGLRSNASGNEPSPRLPRRRSPREVGKRHPFPATRAARRLEASLQARF